MYNSEIKKVAITLVRNARFSKNNDGENIYFCETSENHTKLDDNQIFEDNETEVSSSHKKGNDLFNLDELLDSSAQNAGTKTPNPAVVDAKVANILGELSPEQNSPHK